MRKFGDNYCHGALTFDLDKHCQKKCQRNCKENYYNLNIEIEKALRIDENVHDMLDRNMSIVILVGNDRDSVYIAEPKYVLVEYISDLGGLFGLYFGIALVDISQYIKYVFTRLKTILLKLELRLMKKLFTNMKNILKAIITKIELLVKIKWKNFAKFMTLPLLIYQMSLLIYDYFQFSTQIRFEFLDYKISGNKYLLSEFPAITVCTENMFEHIFFDINYDWVFSDHKSLLDQYDKILSSKINVTHYENIPPYNSSRKWRTYPEYKYEEWKIQQYYQRYTESIENNVVKYFMKYYIKKALQFVTKPFHHDFRKTEFHLNILRNFFVANNRYELHRMLNYYQDKFNNGINNTVDIGRFYNEHLEIKNLYCEREEYCPIIAPLSKLEGPSGICYTYYMNDQNNNYSDIIRITEDKLSEKLTYYVDIPDYLKFNYYIHHHTTLSNKHQENSVLVNDLEKEQDKIVRITKTEYEKLPFPYETNCQDYKNGSQSYCLNDCFNTNVS